MKQEKTTKKEKTEEEVKKIWAKLDEIYDDEYQEKLQKHIKKLEQEEQEQIKKMISFKKANEEIDDLISENIDKFSYALISEYQHEADEEISDEEIENEIFSNSEKIEILLAKTFKEIRPISKNSLYAISVEMHQQLLKLVFFTYVEFDYVHKNIEYYFEEVVEEYQKLSKM